MSTAARLAARLGLPRADRRAGAPSSRARSSRDWSSPGAGSGKTETMAARVVYLVANGQVRPEQVLGSDLHPQGGRARSDSGSRDAGCGMLGAAGRPG